MATVGSVGVEVVPDARDFWRRFQEQTSAGAARAGVASRREFDRGFAAGPGPEIRVRADTSQARAQIAALNSEGSRSSGGLLKALLPLAPALIPLAGAATAAGAEFLALGAAGVLAVTGIKKEMASGSVTGAAYSGLIGQLKNDLGGLQSIASAGVLTGFQQSAGKLRAELPQLNAVIAQQSVLLGSTVSHITGGLVGGFQTFTPLLNQVGESVNRVAARFEAFATGPGGAKFAAVLSTDYAKVAPVIDELVTLIGHLAQAGHGVGLGLVSELGLLARTLDSFPTPVLTAIIDGFLVFRTAAAVNGVVSSIAASFAALGARAQTSALVQTAASLQVEAAAAAEAAGVSAARAAEAEAVAATAASMAASLAGTGSIFEAEAAVVAAASAEEAAAFRARAVAAAASAEVVAASSAEAAAAARAAGASAAAGGVGFAAALGPIGLIAGGLLLLPSLFGGTSDSAAAATASVQSYTSALSASTGVINDSVRAGVAKSLGDAKALEAARKLNISQASVVLAVTSGGKAYSDLQNKLKGLTTGGTQLASLQSETVKLFGASTKTAGASAQTLSDALKQQRDNFVVAAAAARDLVAAQIGLGDASQQTAKELSNGSTAVQGLIAALESFNKSADTAADRGKLIGDLLRSANGDALGFAGSINAAAVANQRFVTDLANAKKGLINLKTGALDYHNAAAAPLISDLQAIQDANVKAAAAVYQHELSTKGAAQASKDAYQTYSTNTRGQLIDEAQKLGYTSTQAKGLADQFFTIRNSGDLKKQIALIGADKTAQALTSIAKSLERLVNTLFSIRIDADTSLVQNKIRDLTNGTIRTTNGHGRITGVKAVGGLQALAGGGEIYGGGTSTSDSVLLRGSKGEFMVNAKQYSRNRGLVQAINAGLPGFAGGGEIGGFSGVNYSSGAGKYGIGTKGNSRSDSTSGSHQTTVAKIKIDYIVEGKHYASLHAAQNAALSAFRGDVKLGLKINGKDLEAFRKSLKGTATQAHDTFLTMYRDARTLGISNRFSKGLLAENAVLDKTISARNLAAARLKTVQDKFTALSANVRSAITGSFNIASAGTGFDGSQRVTGLNILAQSKQQENKVKRFVRDIKLLKGKISGTYLLQLANQGPDALPQAEALLTLPKSQIAALNTSRASIAAQGSSLGKTVGDYFYGGDISKYGGQVKKDNAVIDRLGNRIGGQLERAVDKLAHRPVVIQANGREIARVVNEANKQSARRK